MSNEENFMNEDTVGEPTLTPETFSFFDVLQEVNYPEDVVSVYLDEGAAYNMAKLRREIELSGIDLETPEIENPDAEDEEIIAQVQDYRKRLDIIRGALEESKYTFHLKGVSDDKIVDARDVVEGKFEADKKQRKNAAGHIEKVLPQEKNVDYMRYLDAVVTAIHIQKIEDPQGRINASPSADDIATFFDKAPGAAQAAVRNAVKNLRVESSAYEGSIDEGFLAKP